MTARSMLRSAAAILISVSVLSLAVVLTSRGYSGHAEAPVAAALQEGLPPVVPQPVGPPPGMPAVISAEFYVSVTGNPQASGTFDEPWDIATALSQPEGVVPGSVIWLRGGRYGDSKTYFTSKLKGTAESPIIVRQWKDEHVTLDGALIVNGAYTWFWGFEITSSQTDRTGDRYNPTAGTLDGVHAFGPFTRFINLVVHDTREGFGLWTPAEGAEVTGCIIYHNGWQGPDRGHGHGIYTQNQGAAKLLRDNIIFNQFAMGIHGYGSAKAFVQHFLLEHNAVFNNGSLAEEGRTDNIFFGSGGSMSDIRLAANYTYHTPGANIGTSRAGWNFGGQNEDLSMTGNYFMGGFLALEMRNWNRVNFKGNTMYSASAINVFLQSKDLSNYSWDENRYFGLGRFYLSGQSMNYDAWRKATNFESGSQFTPGAPQGVWTFLHRNPYESSRGNLVIYNWDRSPSVDVDLSSLVAEGASFEIRDAQNYYAAPLQTGTYSGGTISVAMTDLKLTQPLGKVPNPPSHTGPDFAVFVVTSR